MITTFTSPLISSAIFEIIVSVALNTLHRLERKKGKGKADAYAFGGALPYALRSPQRALHQAGERVKIA